MSDSGSFGRDASTVSLADEAIAILRENHAQWQLAGERDAR